MDCAAVPGRWEHQNHAAAPHHHGGGGQRHSERAATSAHDIAQNLHLRGARVTMLQRSSVTVVSLEPSSVRPYEMYRSNDGIRPIADVDMMAASVPYDLLRRLHGPLSRQMAEEDKDLLDGLRRVGFLLDNGEDDTG